MRNQEIFFSPTTRLATEPTIDPADVHRIGAGEHNSSLVPSNQLMLKIHHRLETGTDPEVETLRFLNEVAHFASAPPLLGVVEHVDREENHTVLAILQTFMRNQGDAWTWTFEEVKRVLELVALTPAQGDHTGQEGLGTYVPRVRRLAMRTAQMHMALATPTTDPAFKAEALAFDDVRQSTDRARDLAKRAFARLRKIGAKTSDDIRAGAERLLDRRQECFSLIDALEREPEGAIKIRIHGDYRLSRLCYVRGFYLSIGAGRSQPARLYFNALGHSSRLGNRLFLANVTMPAIWLYLRFTLSFRDVEDLLAERGIMVSYETVRRWLNHFGPLIAADLRKRRSKPHTIWHLDEVYLKIDGRMIYLWRAVDAEGGPRRADPEQEEQAGSAETHAQAFEEIWFCPRQAGHRRFKILCCSSQRSWNRKAP